MKRLLLTTALVAACSGAWAADVPLKTTPLPVTTADPFVGWFLGAEIGYDWSSMKPQLNGAPTFSPDGLIGGGSLSYRSNVAQGWYLGLKSSLDFEGGSNTQAVAKNVTATGHNDWIGTTMVQFGYRILSDLLVYGEGGVGYGAKKASISSKFFSASDTERGAGWALGAGADYNLRAFGMPGLATLEYRHVNLGSSNFGATFGPGITVGTKIKDTDNAILVGYKYKFGG